MPDRLHTGNSAWGALGLAFLLESKKVVLCGVDGTREKYAHMDYKPESSFHHLPGLFASAVPQLAARKMQVVNGSPQSIVDCFPRVSPMSAIHWICGRIGLEELLHERIEIDDVCMERPNTV